MVLHGMVPWARLVTGRIAPAVSGRVWCLDVSARFGAYCTTSTWLTSPSSLIQLQMARLLARVADLERQVAPMKEHIVGGGPSIMFVRRNC